MEFSPSLHSTVPKVHQPVSQSGTQWEKYWFQAPDPFDCEPCHSVNFLETERQLLFFFLAAQLENRLQWQTFIDRLFFISVPGKGWWRLPPRCKPHQLQPDKDDCLFIRSGGFFLSVLTTRKSLTIVLHSGQTVKLQCLTVHRIPKRLFPLRLWGWKNV